MTGKLLIVDDIATNWIVLKVKLSNARYETRQACCGQEALEMIARDPPDLVLLDIRLPDISGIEICRLLRSAPETRHIRIIIITAYDDPDTRLAALSAGADDFFTKPVNETVLLARLRSLVRQHETEAEMALRECTFRELGFAEAQVGFSAPARIALIARERETALHWRRQLAREMARDSLQVLSHDEAMAALGTAEHFDAYVISADLGGAGGGLRLMSELRSRPTSRHSVICIALPPQATETRAMALDLGADDLLAERFPAPHDAQEAALRLRQRLRRKHRLDRHRESLTEGLRLATRDPLTGLFNRRYALPHLDQLAQRAQVQGRPFAVLVLDLDHFKSVNDRWGHAAGDTVLIEVARRLEQNLRASDMVSRLGGEEFLITLPETTLEEARHIAERLCQAVERPPVHLPDLGKSLHVTISIGLTMGGKGAIAPEALIASADHAMLHSKACGRNQVQVLPHPSAA